MLNTENTNIEIYRDALNILDDIEANDGYWQSQDRGPAVTATILYQLLDAKERRKEK